MRTSNAIVDCINNAALEIESKNICLYIAQGLDDGVMFSRLIAESPKNLGYAIHPDSFFSVTEMLIKRMGPIIYPELYVCDDLRFYKFTEGEPRLRPEFRDRYASINFDVLEPANTPATLESTPESSRSNTPEPQVTLTSEIPIADSTREPLVTYEKMKVKGKEEPIIPFLDNEANTSNNTMTIILLTVAVFFVIQAWAYWDRNYNSDVNTNDQSKENTLNSVHESMLTLNEITYKLVLCLIPTFFITMYSLRYYYYYKYFFTKTK